MLDTRRSNRGASGNGNEGSGRVEVVRVGDGMRPFTSRRTARPLEAGAQCGAAVCDAVRCGAYRAVQSVQRGAARCSAVQPPAKEGKGKMGRRTRCEREHAGRPLWRPLWRHSWRPLWLPYGCSQAYAERKEPARDARCPLHTPVWTLPRWAESEHTSPSPSVLYQEAGTLGAACGRADTGELPRWRAGRRAHFRNTPFPSHCPAWPSPPSLHIPDACKRSRARQCNEVSPLLRKRLR